MLLTGALSDMKFKKLYEKEGENCTNMKMALETQRLALESVRVNVQVVQAIEGGNRVMQGIRGEYDADRVEDIMDDMQEQINLGDEIGQAFARQNDGYDNVQYTINLKFS